MNHDPIALSSACVAALLAAAMLGFDVTFPAQAADEPLSLAREGFFYVGARTTEVNGRTFVTDQMYVEVRIPAKQNHPHPIVMVHGGTRSGADFTGTPDGREGWAQYFVRQGYAVYVVDQVGRGRSGYLAASYGQMRNVPTAFALTRFVAQAKSKLWPLAHLHTQWPGTGELDNAATQHVLASQLPSIGDFGKQQILNRDALIALFEKIGPGILFVASASGPYAWPVADARPNLIKAIIAVEPSGPPRRRVRFVGAPDWFKEGSLDLTYGITSAPLAYSPPIKDPSELKFVREDKADGPGLVVCWKQAEPARQLPNLEKIPILFPIAEASDHATYDHCTVKYLEQAGAKPTSIRLADRGIKGNSHVMMLEKNNKEIAAVIAQWLDATLEATR